MEIDKTRAKEIRSRFMWNPITVAIFVVIILLYGWLDVGGVLPAATSLERVVATLGGGALYLSGMYFCLPYLLASQTLQPVPFFWKILILVAGLLVIETTLIALLVSEEHSFGWLLNYFVTSMFTGTVGVLAFCTIFRSNLEKTFGEDPITTIFKPKPAEKIDPLQALLPEDIRGQVFQLEAQTPYLLVNTSRGSALVRMSLKNALPYADESSGWLVHRSRWVHKSRIVDLRRSGRNRFFVDPDGKEFPISREMEKTLRAYLDCPL